MLSLSLHAQQQSPPANQNFYEYRKAFYEKQKEKSIDLQHQEEIEDGELEQFQRMEWWTAPRVYPTGDWKNFSKLSLDAELSLNNSSRSSNGRWQACGPNSINAVISAVQGIGRVNRIVFGQSGALYAATAQGGLWKRVGSTWTCLTNFIPNLTVSGIAIDPIDENVIYIITGDADGSSGPAYNSLGIFKTQDGGTSWYKTGFDILPTTPWSGYKIVEHPTSGNILMVASSAGILRSTDSGISWDTVATDGANNSFYDIEMKPDNPNIWYACTKDHIFRSTNAGLNWNTPHTSNSINTDGQVSRAALAVTAANPNIVYILSGLAGQATGRFTRLQRSTNAGTTFSFTTMSDYTNTGNILGWSYNATTLGTQAGYDLAIAASPTNADEIYIGGINVWYNNAGGAAGSWSLGSHWSPEAGTTVDRMHADQHDIVYQGGDLYVGNDGGAYYHDIGAIDPNWDVIYQGLNISQFYSVELDPTNPNGHTLLGAQDNGELLYDGDDNFQLLYGGDGGEGLVDPTDNNRYYFYINDNLLKDGCDLCWPGTDSPQPGCGCNDDVTPTPSWVGNRALEVDPTFHSRIYSGYTCLFRSDNEGGNWSWQSSIPCSGNETIVDLDFDASNRLWVTKGFHVYRQNAAFSGSFTDVTATLPVGGAQLTGLACSNTNAQVAFITFSGYYDGIKVFETTDGGTTWFNISGYLPNVPVNCIVYQPNTDDGLYIGTDIGVFYYDNSTVLWTPFRNGMPSVAVADLEISSVDNMLYAATFGRGLWKSDLFTGCQSALKILDGIISTDGYVGPFQFTSGYNTYRTIDSTIINMPLTGGLGQNTLLISEGYIKLKEGFQATNTDFTAKYDQYCFNGFYSYLKGEYAGELYPQQNQNPVSSNENEIQLSVYPNPFNKELKMGVIVSNSEIPIQVFFTDLAGKIITVPYKQSTYDGNTIGFRFDTSELANGAYIISVQSGNFTQTKKVIKLSAE